MYNCTERLCNNNLAPSIIIVIVVMIMIEIIIILTLMMIMTFYYQADMKCFEYNFKCMYHITYR